MGLDMYLVAKRGFWHPNDQLADAINALLQREIDLLGDGTGYRKGVTALEIRAAYWRKANQIHGWFVENVQGGDDDCQPYEVSREQLTALRDLCKSVLDTAGESADIVATDTQTLITKAADTARVVREMLPPVEGFFFGDTEVGEYYFDDLRYTLDQCNKLLQLDETWDFEYQSSW